MAVSAETETIFASATAAGKAGVAVVRVSGPQVPLVAELLCGGLPAPRVASLRPVRSDGHLIDEAVILYFAAGHSFTGEAVLELQCHGSRAVVAAILAALGGVPGCRLAEPGEFTRRALENSRLDLPQIEGLADLVEAETEAQRKQAIAVLSGALSSRTDAWRGDLVRAAALLEATIDFADEEVPVDVSPEVRDLITGVLQSLEKEIVGWGASERLRHGFEVAIVGAPNVGKSTLLNTLAGRDAAITSDIAGTTRDVIEVRMDIEGIPVTLLDTAGIREAIDNIEKIGVDRALKRAKDADLRVFLGEIPEGIPAGSEDLLYRPKIDAPDGKAKGISGLTGHGVDDLLQRLGETLAGRVQGAGLMIRRRHVDSATRAVSSLTQAMGLMDHGAETTELVSEEVRSAIRSLDSLIGRVDVENILDEIFASFCLGK